MTHKFFSGITIAANPHIKNENEPIQRPRRTALDGLIFISPWATVDARSGFEAGLVQPQNALSTQEAQSYG